MTGSVGPGVPAVQRFTAILWPSFIMAGVATAVFFTFLDPREVMECTGDAPISRTGAYSLGFFAFWLLTGSAGAGTAYFLQQPRVPSTGR